MIVQELLSLVRSKDKEVHCPKKGAPEAMLLPPPAAPTTSIPSSGFDHLAELLLACRLPSMLRLESFS